MCDEKYALGTDLDPKFDNCCTWACSSRMFRKDGPFTKGQNNEFCGVTLTKAIHKGQQRLCCEAMLKDGKKYDCDFQGAPKGPAFKAIIAYAKDEQKWLDAYQMAWRFATENGHENLVPNEAGTELEPYDCGSHKNRWDCSRAYQCDWEANAAGGAALAQTPDEVEVDDYEVADDSFAQTEAGKSWRKQTDGTCSQL